MLHKLQKRGLLKLFLLILACLPCEVYNFAWISSSMVNNNYHVKHSHWCPWSWCDNKCKMLIFLPLPFSAYRLSETEWWPGAGALPGRYLPLSDHLSGLPHAHSARQAGWGLWLRKAATPSHLPQPGLHGTAAAVWDWRSLSGMKNQTH